MEPYIISSFRGGISDEDDKGIRGSFKHGHGLDIHGRSDVLTCASTVVTVNESLITDLIRFFVPSSDGSTYAFGSTGSIYARSGDKGDGAWNFAYNDSNGEIKGAAEFQTSDGVAYMFWATNTSVARRSMAGGKDLPWTNATQDYKTTLTAADWHTMKVSSGELMIANANAIAKFDYDGDFDALALNLIPGNLIKALEERDDFSVMGTERSDESEEGHIWSWIITAVNWVQKKKIPIKGVNSVIFTEFPVLQGGNQGEIFPADFSNTVPLAAVPGGGETMPGGVTIENDLALFGMYGGTYPGIWSYGRRHKNRSHALNFQYRLAKTVAGSSVSTIGAVSTVNGETLIAWGTTDGSTSDYGVDQVSSTTKATGNYEGLEFDGGRPDARKGIEGVKVTFSPLPSGTSFSIKFKLDKESAWRYAVLSNGSTTFSTADQTEARFILGKPGHIYEVGAELNPSGSSAPEIHSITSYISSIEQTHG